jgi:hypothetical protein
MLFLISSPICPVIASLDESPSRQLTPAQAGTPHGRLIQDRAHQLFVRSGRDASIQSAIYVPVNSLLEKLRLVVQVRVLFRLYFYCSGA